MVISRRQQAFELPCGRKFNAATCAQILAEAAEDDARVETLATPERIYEQVLSYRIAFPARPRLHTIYSDALQTWAFLIGGGSLLVRPMGYPIINEGDDPPATPSEYPPPWEFRLIEPIRTFIDNSIAELLPAMSPCPQLISEPTRNWCLSGDGSGILIFKQRGTRLEIDLAGLEGELSISWFDPETGLEENQARDLIAAGSPVTIDSPSDRHWILWLH